MKIKKIYRFDNNRQIWRILPTYNGKLVIEERNPELKQVYFHCLETKSGKKIFEDFQLDDKFWVGIEAIQNDIIYFHKFAKPDMPKHRGIFAYDIRSQNLVWENPELIFQFLSEDKLYAFKERFEGKFFYSLNPFNGEIIEEIGDNHNLVNELRNEALHKQNNQKYLFPELINEGSLVDHRAIDLVKKVRNDFVVSGNIEFILVENMLMISFHEVSSKGSYNNIFKAVDLNTGKYILEEVINKETSLYLTDSFFVKDNFLFLLFGKSRLQVYKIIF
jgi:hypothetical protein